MKRKAVHREGRHYDGWGREARGDDCWGSREGGELERVFRTQAIGRVVAGAAWITAYVGVVTFTVDRGVAAGSGADGDGEALVRACFADWTASEAVSAKSVSGISALLSLSLWSEQSGRSHYWAAAMLFCENALEDGN